MLSPAEGDHLLRLDRGNHIMVQLVESKARFGAESMRVDAASVPSQTFFHIAGLSRVDCGMERDLLAAGTAAKTIEDENKKQKKEAR
jgi:hypothetical protein